MARWNVTAPARGPIQGTNDYIVNHQGGAGFTRDTKSELFLAAVSSFNEDTYYETSGQRISRIRPLVQDIACRDVEWLIGLVGWLRRTANLRTIAIAIAADGVAARLASTKSGQNRALVSAAILRADESAEFLGYWTATYGNRKIPSAVKRAIADALNSLTENDWLKWRGKGERGAYSMVDLINLVHPTPKSPTQDALFAAAMAHSYGRDIPAEVLVKLPMVNARQVWLSLNDKVKHAFLHDAQIVRNAGITHEVAAGALGKLTAEDWEALIPTMGFQALLMNLRRMHEAGLNDRARTVVASRLRNDEAILRSRMLPMRFLSAYRNAPLEYAGDLEYAANIVLQNVPSLPGRSLILVDRSGSMDHPLSGRGTLKRVDAANVFGAALALRAESADLVAFGTRSQAIRFRKSDSLLRLADQPANMGGTSTRSAIADHYRDHDRIILLTDEQASYSYGWNQTADVFEMTVPTQVPTFTWNLAGYRAGHAPEGPNRFTFGGLSDSGMGMILPLERGISQNWPWLQK